jgi:hypothetical protein
LIKLTAVERAEIVDVARRGAKRCRDAMINLRFSDPQHKIEMHQELEEIARMWESLAASALTLELPVVESPVLSATENSAPMDHSEIERTYANRVFRVGTRRTSQAALSHRIMTDIRTRPASFSIVTTQRSVRGARPATSQ